MGCQLNQFHPSPYIRHPATPTNTKIPDERALIFGTILSTSGLGVLNVSRNGLRSLPTQGLKHVRSLHPQERFDSSGGVPGPPKCPEQHGPRSQNRECIARMGSIILGILEVQVLLGHEGAGACTTHAVIQTRSRRNPIPTAILE